jgi:hypothetical protein
LGRDLFRLSLRLQWFSEGTDFFNRTDPDAIGLAQCSVHSTGFCDPHFGPVNEVGDVGRISVAIADKAGRFHGWKDRGLKDEAVRREIAK